MGLTCPGQIVIRTLTPEVAGSSRVMQATGYTSGMSFHRPDCFHPSRELQIECYRITRSSDQPQQLRLHAGFMWHHVEPLIVIFQTAKCSTDSSSRSSRVGPMFGVCSTRDLADTTSNKVRHEKHSGYGGRTRNTMHIRTRGDQRLIIRPVIQGAWLRNKNDWIGASELNSTRDTWRVDCGSPAWECSRYSQISTPSRICL